MADQKTVNQTFGNGRANDDDNAAEELGGNIADFTHDVASLVELQSELFTIDLRDATDISLLPLCIGVSGFLLLLAAFPVLLIGLAYLMVAAWDVTPALAFFATGAGAILISAGIVWLVWIRVCKALAQFNRSQAELKRNFAWIKRRLRSRGARQR